MSAYNLTEWWRYYVPFRLTRYTTFRDEQHLIVGSETKVIGNYRTFEAAVAKAPEGTFRNIYLNTWYLRVDANTTYVIQKYTG